jgi:hypothetical protein
MANIFADPNLQAAANFFFGTYQQHFLSIALYTVFIVFYAIIVWNLYKFITKENVFVFEGMDEAKIPALTSAFMYLVVFPIITFCAFFFFALLVIFMAKEQSVQQILVISATLISVIRIMAYYSEELAQDVAKLIPLTLLAVFLVDPTYYSTAVVLERLQALPGMMGLIMRYLFFIVLLEWALRGLHRVRQHVYEKK